MSDPFGVLSPQDGGPLQPNVDNALVGALSNEKLITTYLQWPVEWPSLMLPLRSPLWPPLEQHFRI